MEYANLNNNTSEELYRDTLASQITNDIDKSYNLSLDNDISNSHNVKESIPHIVVKSTNILYERMIASLNSEISFLRDLLTNRESYFREEIEFLRCQLKNVSITTPMTPSAENSFEKIEYNNTINANNDNLDIVKVLEGEKNNINTKGDEVIHKDQDTSNEVANDSINSNFEIDLNDIHVTSRKKNN